MRRKETKQKERKDRREKKWDGPRDRCRECKQKLKKWKTEGLSGLKCECGATHLIDQYPHDYQTKRLRWRISQTKDTSKFREIDWVEAEKEFEKKQNKTEENKKYDP